MVAREQYQPAGRSGPSPCALTRAEAPLMPGDVSAIRTYVKPESGETKTRPQRSPSTSLSLPDEWSSIWRSARCVKYSSCS